jgi:hypothetical protein
MTMERSGTTPEAPALSRFQDDFAHALLGAVRGEPPSPAIDALIRQAGFAVYRNTVVKGCADALLAQFPAVTRLVGEEWMRAAAIAYASVELPSTPVLLDYGASFPDFLRSFEPARALPYLADVARLDRAWTEAHVALDAPVLDSASLGALDPDVLAAMRLVPHPAARALWFEAQPIYTLWSRNRDPDVEAIGEVDWVGEGALVTRPEGAVRWCALSRAGASFFAACAAGATMEEALGRALDADPACDPRSAIEPLFAQGAFRAREVT